MDDDHNIGMSFADVRNWLWECREREITHMWQRGTFLATFVVGAFTAYYKVIQLEGYPRGILNCVAIVIALIGIVLSLLWIAMAKGASAWYSIYEQAILDLVRSYFKRMPPFAIPHSADELLVSIIGQKCPIVRPSTREYLGTWSDSYCRGTGGKYSLPRINIAIGHLLFLVWAGLIVCNAMWLMVDLHPEWVSIFRVHKGALIYVIPVLLCMVTAMAYSLYSRYFLRSESLTNYMKNVAADNGERRGTEGEINFARLAGFFSHGGCVFIRRMIRIS